MRNLTKVLGVAYDVLTMDEAVKKAIELMDQEKNNMVCTPNPEIVMAARKDDELMKILNLSDMVIADGIGVVWASKYTKKRLPERVAGYDLTQRLFNELKDTHKTIFFFGGAPGVAKEAAEKMMKKYPGLNIVGTRNGYFSKEEEVKIVSDIKALKPDLLLVGLGAPKQEKWIYKYKDEIGAGLSIGVGGSFDVMADKVKRAPDIFCKLGLEWFYRLIKQPTRIKRMMQLPKFALTVLKNKNRM